MRSKKQLFLDICIYAVMADKEFAKEEKELIEQYCMEMQLPEIRFTAMTEFEEAVDRLLEISSKEKLQLIVKEVARLIMSDKHFDEFERQFSEQFVDRIGMSREAFAAMLER